MNAESEDCFVAEDTAPGLAASAVVEVGPAVDDGVFAAGVAVDTAGAADAAV